MPECVCGSDCRALPVDHPSVRVIDTWQALQPGFRRARPWPGTPGAGRRAGADWVHWTRPLAAHWEQQAQARADAARAAGDQWQLDVSSAMAARYSRFVEACDSYIAAQTAL